MRISDWSSDVCSSDLQRTPGCGREQSSASRSWVPSCPSTGSVAGASSPLAGSPFAAGLLFALVVAQVALGDQVGLHHHTNVGGAELVVHHGAVADEAAKPQVRSEEHTSELQSLMRISYAVFCL